MPTSFPAPTEQAIEALLGGLVSLPTHVTRAPATDPERETIGVFADFVTDDDEVAVLAYADHDVVNFVGGAMVGVDADAMQDASGKAVLLDQGVEGFRGVLNVFASCLNSDYTKTLRLGEVTVLPGEVADDVKQLWRQPSGRRTYRVTVDDTGAGAIILYLG